ncbi:ABC transporter substrate-binding protein [Frankia sp. CNm7]|uniref:ABC transporter substrate-binding protein n=1 Tax=Frankia nepalensis TaxID=1836974 RepID=A0A937RJA8_9ACTN|nr:ABC transporter substrate-binding protein [Frankia nepalensis]MBL7500937.1 ABC transporter substrate-binding protein [Frankia nepalensis]MBL7510088.1 ABC transporter substrate-binding protein [Frankia nepalensis]MBL7521749.1 ABC transporter substrate-binding protein [Frankia nepalensis]MBL7633306.1 ABC transporter substrate-binding protein [Frankia nepalensis]
MVLAPYRRSPRSRAALAASTVGLAALVACGGPTNETASVGISCETTAPGVTATEVKIGLLHDDSGPSAEAMRAFRGGVDARLGVTNEEDGGVFGRTVTYAWRDDQADPSINLQAARQLVTDENVFGIIEAPGAEAGSAEWLHQQGVPVTGLASDRLWTRYDNMFSWFYLGEGSVTTWGDFIRSRGGTRAAVFAISGNEANFDFSRQFKASLLETGVEIINIFEVAGTTNYVNIAQQIKASGVDTIAGVLLPDAAAELLPALRDAGVRPKVVMMPLGYDQNVLARYGQQLAGTVIYSAVKPFELNTTEQQAMLTAMTTYAPQAKPPQQDSAVDGYVAADLLLRGLREAGACPTRESFINALRAVNDYNGAGLIPHSVDLSTNRNKISVCYSFVQVGTDGQRFVPLSEDATCGQEITSQKMDQLLSNP